MDSNLDLSPTPLNQILKRESAEEFRSALDEFLRARFGALRAESVVSRAASGRMDAESLEIAGARYRFPVDGESSLKKATEWVSAFGAAIDSKRELLELRAERSDSTEQVVRALALTLNARNEATSTHVQRVTVYCDLLCAELGLEARERREVVLAGLLHDLGKIAVPDRVLLKESALDAGEWTEMRAHTEVGYEIVRSFPTLGRVADILRFHHERWDGTGYPNRLIGEGIPFGARVIAVADAFDAMTSDRPYRRAFPFAKAYSLVTEMAGVQFDPSVVEAFVAIAPDLREIRSTPRTRVPQLSPLDSIGSF